MSKRVKKVQNDFVDYGDFRVLSGNTSQSDARFENLQACMSHFLTAACYGEEIAEWTKANMLRILQYDHVNHSRVQKRTTSSCFPLS